MLAERDLALSPFDEDPALRAFAEEAKREVAELRELAEQLLTAAEAGDDLARVAVARLVEALNGFHNDMVAMATAGADAYNQTLEETEDPDAAKSAGYEAIEEISPRLAPAGESRVARLESSMRAWAQDKRPAMRPYRAPNWRSRGEQGRSGRRRARDTQPAANGSRGSPDRPRSEVGPPLVDCSSRAEDEPRKWFEQHPTLSVSRQLEFGGTRAWSGSRLWREVILADPEDAEGDELPSRGAPEEVAVARASRPEPTRCNRCRRDFADPATKGRSPGRAFCRSCESKRKAKQRERIRRELAKLEGAA